MHDALHKSAWAYNLPRQSRGEMREKMTGQQQAFNFEDKRAARRRELFKDVNAELLERFNDYHEANPQVYALFKKYAYEAKRAGRTRFSVWMIGNRVRWFSTVESKGDDYKINNDYLALYARLLIVEDESFEKLFELRKMKADRKVMAQSRDLYAHKLAG